MKKGKYIGIGFIILIVILAAIKFKGYYEDRYKGTDYYAVVRSASTIEPEDMLDDSGRVMDQGHYYKLRAYNDKGEMVVAEFGVMSDDASGLYQNDTYLKIEHSKTIVVKQQIVSKEEVPEKVLKDIENDTAENK